MVAFVESTPSCAPGGPNRNGTLVPCQLRPVVQDHWGHAPANDQARRVSGNPRRRSRRRRTSPAPWPGGGEVHARQPRGDSGDRHRRFLRAPSGRGRRGRAGHSRTRAGGGAPGRDGGPARRHPSRRPGSGRAPGRPGPGPDRERLDRAREATRTSPSWSARSSRWARTSYACSSASGPNRFSGRLPPPSQRPGQEKGDGAQGASQPAERERKLAPGVEVVGKRRVDQQPPRPVAG